MLCCLTALNIMLIVFGLVEFWRWIVSMCEGEAAAAPDLVFLVSKVACGQDHSLFLTDTGKVFSCGWGADGQTGR